MAILFCFASCTTTNDIKAPITLFVEKETYPGDPIFVQLNTIYKGEINATAEFLQDEKVIAKSELYLIQSSDKKTERQTLVALIPLSTYAPEGVFNIKVNWTCDNIPQETLSQEINILPKKFVEETIPLNAQNTSIRTSTSTTKTEQINRLNEIIFTTTKSDNCTLPRFYYPTTATRRTSFFGDRRIFLYSDGKTATSLHNGIDYGIPIGTDVFACADGKVVLAENRISTGNSIVIEHFPGLYSLYYHLDSLAVTENQIIEAKSLIGKSGCTGVATGPHLHWEIRLQGMAVNPDYFVK